MQDSGIGIAAAELTHIFDMFVQVDTSLERMRSGLGFGLTLVKKLVTMHGATVEARSLGLGQGSEFIVRLPIVGAPTAAPHDAKQSRPRSRRIVVADDNVDAAVSLAELLKLSGHDVHIAHDGLAAVKAAETFQPDVIVLDIGMPALNGYEAARRIRSQGANGDVLLIALTGYGQDSDKSRAKEAGFDLHVVKPVDIAKIEEILAMPPGPPK